MGLNSNQNVKFVNLDIFVKMERFRMFANSVIIMTRQLENVLVVKKGRNADLLLAKKQFANSIHTIRLKNRQFVLNANMEKLKAVQMALLLFSDRKHALIAANFPSISKNLI